MQFSQILLGRQMQARSAANHSSRFARAAVTARIMIENKREGQSMEIQWQPKLNRIPWERNEQNEHIR